MRYKTFSIRILEEIADAIEAEASREHRTRNQQIQKDLADRYGHSPPVITTNGTAVKQTVRARTKRTSHTN